MSAVGDSTTCYIASIIDTRRFRLVQALAILMKGRDMVAIEWSAAHEIGLVPMDRMHREFVDLYNNLVHADSADFLDRFNDLIQHTLAHFDRENTWMERSGFPPSVIHRGEHERVLRLMHAARDRIATGDVEFGREFGAQLPAWFEQHAATMDAALAMHMRRARFEPDDDAAAAAAA